MFTPFCALPEITLQAPVHAPPGVVPVVPPIALFGAPLISTPLEEFRAAVRCAVATPFLAGDGNRGWQASFDWLIANRTNARKVLAGEYAPQASARTASERARAGRPRAERHVPADLYTGVGPRPADCGVRVNPAALERIRERQAQARASPAILKS